MKFDKLNLSKSCRPGVKMALLTILVMAYASAPLNADDSQTAHVVLDRLARSLTSQKQQTLREFSARSHTLFVDFFDIGNNLPYTIHKARFENFAKELYAYINTIKCSFSSKDFKEATLLAKQFNGFIKTLDKHAQPVIKKGSNVTNADIVPLAMPLKDYSFLIPDIFFKNLPEFLNAIRHRLSCS